MIGYEFEYLVREGDRPLTHQSFSAFHRELEKRGWKPEFDPGTGGLIGSLKDGVEVKSDDGVGIMEINLPPTSDLSASHLATNKILAELQSIYQSLGASIIGVSTFPGFFDLNQYTCADKCLDPQSCEKSYIQYPNAQRWSRGHHGLFLIASHQVWLDVAKADAMRQRNTFERISGLILALTANGPLCNNERLPQLEGRDFFWRQMLASGSSGNDEKYFGLMPEAETSIFDYFDHIMSMPFYVSLRNGKGFSLRDKSKKYSDFFFGGITQAQWYDETPFETTPTLDDFFELQHATFPWVRLKYRFHNQTTLEVILDAYKKRDETRFLDCFSSFHLECRAGSAQPQADLSALPALYLGLQNSFDRFEALVKKYPYIFWQGLYHEALKSGLAGEYQGQTISTLAGELCQIAFNGLLVRGLGEEIFLQPFFQRVANRQNPADEVVALWSQSGLTGVFEARDYK